MGRLIDISLPVQTGMVTWPGDPGVEVERLLDMARGNAINLSRLACGCHTGTHVDAPLHFINGGASLDRIPLETLVGPCRVVRVADGSIQPEHLSGLEGVRRVLFRTDNSDHWGTGEGFRPDFAYLSPEAAEALAGMEVALVGVDYLSVDKFKGGGAAHRALLGRGMVALEGLNLAGVEAGDYELICLPLRLIGVEGAPARALLREL